MMSFAFEIIIIYRLNLKMTRSVNKTKQYTVLLEETLFECYLTFTWKCACKVEWSKPSDNIIHGHSHSMDMSKADNSIDGCIMALKNNSGKYAFVSCYFILHYRHHIVFFSHTTHYSHLLENDVIKQQNRKFAYFCIV